MVIVYTYRKEGQDGHGGEGADGLELKYSIRSMEKYFTDLERSAGYPSILLVGDKPSWYKGDYMFCEDVQGRPATSIMRKMLHANVENFLWSADDHFALKPFGADLPNYYNKHARQVDYKMKRMIGNCPNDWLNYICHTPMVINRTKLQAAFDWAAGREFPIKTLYANFNNLPGTTLIDLKFRGNVSYEEIKARIYNRPFFSTHENAMQGNLIRVMNELYPLPSSQEK